MHMQRKSRERERETLRVVEQIFVQRFHDFSKLSCCKLARLTRRCDYYLCIYGKRHSVHIMYAL